MFGFITKSLAARYGVPYLFLNPEYLDELNFFSYLLVGLTCGGFIMAFNISSYIMNSFRFPFLATLSNPFIKYCLNNSIIPICFVITYIVQIRSSLIKDELMSTPFVLLLISGFILGLGLFIFLALSYFFRTNKDIFKMFGVQTQEHDMTRRIPKTKKIVLRKDLQWKNLNNRETRDWHVETYLVSPFKIRLARGFEHYEKEMLHRVFKQNHKNAAVFEIVVIVTLFMMGFFRDIPVFTLPAGASIFLWLTMVLMFTSAMYNWFRGWSFLIILGIFLILNSLYQLDIFHNESKVYGLNYNTTKADFSLQALKEANDQPQLLQRDIDQTIDILTKWKQKNSKNGTDSANYKPKLVLINTSGGGLRSALWTFYTLQYVDSLLKGDLIKHTQLITGSSGGMVGAAYFRELYLIHQQKKLNSYYNPVFRSNISKDILNPMILSIAVNDFFFPFQKVVEDKHKYSKDRAYAFENKLNENTSHILDKKLKDYLKWESEAVIPMMIFSPTIINDGRKLLVSPLPISYLAQNTYNGGHVSGKRVVDAIEYCRFFKAQNADNTLFTSVLRMNATFPYITPVISLPSEPRLEVIDAGMRDNYGLETSLKFLFTFRDWICANTSGVVVIQIRDRYKEIPIEKTPLKSISQTLSSPLGSLYGNIFHVQDYNQNQLMQYADAWFSGKIDVVNFEMKNERPDHISLSWHLTNKEKKKVLESIHLPTNQQSIQVLKELLGISDAAKTITSIK